MRRFFSGRGFFLQGGGGEENIFLDQGFFFAGKGGGFKSRLCLRFVGKGEREKSIFFSDRGFFLRGRGKEFLGPRKEKGTKINTRNKGRKN
jgi:hypothetical protein